MRNSVLWLRLFMASAAFLLSATYLVRVTLDARLSRQQGVNGAVAAAYQSHIRRSWVRIIASFFGGVSAVVLTPRFQQLTIFVMVLGLLLLSMWAWWDKRHLEVIVSERLSRMSEE